MGGTLSSLFQLSPISSGEFYSGSSRVLEGQFMWNSLSAHPRLTLTLSCAPHTHSTTLAGRPTDWTRALTIFPPADE